MGIRQTTSPRQIKQDIDTFIKNGENQILDRLFLLGQTCYEQALSKKGYQNRTGNLGSSTGFIILNNGRLVRQGGFRRINGPDRDTTNIDGSQLGREYADLLAREYPSGYVLIFVAGMNYAGYVEAKGYNVITSAEIWAQREAENLLKQVL